MSWEANRDGPARRTSDGRPDDGPRRISPYARRLAAQVGLQIDDLVGTGPGGEVGAKDVRRAGMARAGRDTGSQARAIAGRRLLTSGTPAP